MRFFLILAFFFLHVNLFASDKVSYFDKNDSMLDLSEHLLQAYGFMPIPVLITEPAVGYGGGVALVYLHDKIAGKKTASGRRIPPSISAVMFAAIQNGTKVAGAAHIGYWLEDTMRTTTYVGSPNVFIDIYKENIAIEMNLKGLFFYQDATFRISESNFFLGGSYMYFGADTTFDFEDIENDFGGEDTVSCVGLIAQYDSRDNHLSPNRGMLLNFKANIYSDTLGSDYSFENYKINATFYNPLTSKINLDFNLIAPYLYPFISMRGIPMMRYQGENIVSLETQFSYQFDSRWRGLG